MGNVFVTAALFLFLKYRGARFHVLMANRRDFCGSFPAILAICQPVTNGERAREAEVYACAGDFMFISSFFFVFLDKLNFKIMKCYRSLNNYTKNIISKHYLILFFYCNLIFKNLIGI